MSIDILDRLRNNLILLGDNISRLNNSTHTNTNTYTNTSNNRYVSTQTPSPTIVPTIVPTQICSSNIDKERDKKTKQEHLELLAAKVLYNQINECNICFEDKYVIKCGREKCTLMMCSLCIACDSEKFEGINYECPVCKYETTIADMINEIDKKRKLEQITMYSQICPITDMIYYAHYYNVIKYPDFTYCYIHTNGGAKVRKSIRELYSSNNINKFNDIIIGFYGIYYNDVDKHYLNDGYLTIYIKSNKYRNQLDNINFTVKIAENNIQRQQRLYELLCEITDNIYNNGYNTNIFNKLNNLKLEYC
jgi:hypothetical protein